MVFVFLACTILVEPVGLYSLKSHLLDGTIAATRGLYLALSKA